MHPACDATTDDGSPLPSTRWELDDESGVPTGEMNKYRESYGRDCLLLSRLVWYLREQLRGGPPVTHVEGYDLEVANNVADKWLERGC